MKIFECRKQQGCYVRDKDPDADQCNAESLYLFSQKSEARLSEMRGTETQSKS